jgi:RES domain-containing protein
MSIWYRVAALKDAKKVFSGDGGLHVSGRWHFKGTKAVYCSQNLSLCTLEWLAHHGCSFSGVSYYKYSIEVPDELILRPELKELPEEWDAIPDMDASRGFAHRLLFNEARYVALVVPSVVTQEEYNIVMNPEHDEFKAILRSVKLLGFQKLENR